MTPSPMPWRGCRRPTPPWPPYCPPWSEALPEFAPRTLLDVGAGPGTASFAAAHRYGSLQQITLRDHNPHLRELGLTLLAASDRAALREAAYDRGEASAAAGERRRRRIWSWQAT